MSSLHRLCVVLSQTMALAGGTLKASKKSSREIAWLLHYCEVTPQLHLSLGTILRMKKIIFQFCTPTDQFLPHKETPPAL